MDISAGSLTDVSVWLYVAGLADRHVFVSVRFDADDPAGRSGFVGVRLDTIGLAGSPTVVSMTTRDL